MAVNPNFTNANAFTPYATGGGGSNFPDGIIVGGGFGTRYIDTDQFFGQPTGTTFWVAPSKLQLDTVQANSVKLIDNGLTNSYAYVSPIGITYVSTATVGSPQAIQAFLLPNYGAMSNINSNVAFGLLGISSLTSGQYTANANALMSSLKATFPSNFS